MPQEDRIKIALTVTLSRVYNIPQKLEGSSIFVAWRRGSNRLSGITKRALVKDGQAIWGEPIEVECPFVRNSETGEFGSKSMSFIIKEDQLGRTRSQKSLAKASIDLASYVTSDPTEFHTARFKLGKKTKLLADPPIMMSYTVRVVWLKFNDKVLKRMDGSSSDSMVELDEDLRFEVESDSEVFSAKESLSVCSLSDEENVDQLLESGDILQFPDECDEAPALRRVVEQLEEECYQRMKTLRTRNAEVHRLKSKLKKQKRRLRAAEAEARRVKDQLVKARADHLEDARREMDATLEAASCSIKRNSKRAAVVIELEEALRSQHARIELLQAEADFRTTEPPPDHQYLDELEQKISEYKSTLLSLTHQLEEKNWSLRAYEKRFGASPEQTSLLRESTGTEMEGQPNLEDALKREADQLKSVLAIRTLIEKNVYRVEPGFLAGAELARSHMSRRRQRRERKLLGERATTERKGEGRGGERESGVSVSAENILSALLEWGVLPSSTDDPESRIEMGLSANDRASAGTDVLDAIESVSRHADPIMLSYWLSTTSSLLRFLNEEFDRKGGSPSRWHFGEDSATSAAVSEMGLQLEELVVIVFRRLLQQFYRDASPIVVAAVLELPAMKIGINVTSTSVIPMTVGNLSTTGTLLPLLDRYLALLLENNVPRTLIQQFVYECFGFVNATVFNHLILHKELCNCATGFQLKIELSQFEQWLTECGLKSDTLSQTLGHAEQAANVLFMDKGVLLDPDARKTVCPSLTVHQILRLIENFVPDNLSDKSIPVEVLKYFQKACREDFAGSRIPITISVGMTKPLSLDW